MSKRKTVNYIRHFQAMHNIAPFNYQLIDPELTLLASTQASATIELVKTIPRIDLIVCSPLTRTLQTYLLIFEHLDRDRNIPLIIHPGLQEVCSEPCDTGRPIVDLKRDFPSLIDALNVFEQTFGDDQWRDKVNPQNFYSPQRVEERTKSIVDWLIQRPEQSIVVISHNLMLKHIFQLNNEQVDMFNGEMKTIEYFSQSDQIKTNVS